MTFSSPNSIAVKGISDRESGATSVVHSEAALGDASGLAVTLSCEMDVLYNPLHLNSESRTRITQQNEANTLNTE